MPEGVGLVFVSTGGPKILRAIRSFRRTEPDMPVHVLLDTSSATWRNGGHTCGDSLRELPGVTARTVENTGYINGAFNAAMRWMRELRYEYACVVHDDVIFPWLAEPSHEWSGWFTRVRTDETLRRASALSLGFIQAFVRAVWKRPAEEWDAMDLESASLWEMLCPGGRPAAYWRDDGTRITEIDLSTFVAHYYCVDHAFPMNRLGPVGQIVPIAVWERVGEFDERDGIFYDIQFPAECAVRGEGPVLVIPNTPMVHLHNQSIGYADPANGIWSNTTGAFNGRYGADFWQRRSTA